MLETYFSAPKMLGHLRSGPSGPSLDGFAAILKREGYSPATAVRYLRAAAHLGHFMCQQSRTLADVDLPAFSEHLQACQCPRSKGGRCNHHTVYGARYFRGFLLAIGVCVAGDSVCGAGGDSPLQSEVAKASRAATATIRLYARGAGRLYPG